MNELHEHALDTEPYFQRPMLLMNVHFTIPCALA
jgi:hypothetical protein